jgi:hypothetical protein
MNKMLSGSEMDYKEFVESELLRICWNLVTTDRVTLAQLFFYPGLFDQDRRNPFPPLTEWRKQRAVEIRLRQEGKDYTSVIQAKLEAKRWFYTHILSPCNSSSSDQFISRCERVGGLVPSAWKLVYEHRRDYELLKYQEEIKLAAQKSPYPKAKIERELNWWSWVLSPESLVGSPKEFVKKFESDASFRETRKLASEIIEGNATFEQIGVLEDVGWRKYASADARIQYKAWLIENRENNQIWEGDTSIVVAPYEERDKYSDILERLHTLTLSIKLLEGPLGAKKSVLIESDNSDKRKQIIDDKTVTAIYEGLKGFFPGKAKELRQLLSGKKLKQRLHFPDNQNRLVEVFSRAYYHGKISGTKKMVQIWLVDNFTYFNVRKKVQRPLSLDTLRSIFNPTGRGEPKRVKRIEIEGLPWLPISERPRSGTE